MRVRTALLAMLLLDLAAGATWYAGRYGPGQAAELRLFLLWALPGLVYLCGVLTREPKPRQVAVGGLAPRLRLPGIALPALPPVKPVLPVPVPPTAAVGGLSPVPVGGVRWPRLLWWIALAVVLDLAPLGIGFQAGWLTFTFGESQLLSSRLMTALWAWPLLMAVSIRFYESTLRGRLFSGLAESWGAAGAWMLSLLCGTALALPAIAPGFVFAAPVVAAAGLATALGREIGATVLFRASGLVAAGIFRGTLVFLDFFLVADWLHPVFPSADYSSGSGTFHLLRAASPLAAALLLARALPARRLFEGPATSEAGA
ncbi:MAG: hypothetical protein ABI689_03210 [Thermoanaerobaculia bacterium]